MDDLAASVWAWRHPRPRGATGRCIGRTDLAVDPRRAKRLARRIQAIARREGLPRVVHTSALRRCADVGRWLRRWGWVHRIDASLLEMDFGGWDGRFWSGLSREDVDAWCADFADHAPGGGEALSAMLDRAARWTPATETGEPAFVLVAHAGWMSARRWVNASRHALPTADQWPAPPRYGELWRLPQD